MCHCVLNGLHQKRTSAWARRRSVPSRRGCIGRNAVAVVVAVGDAGVAAEPLRSMMLIHALRTAIEAHGGSLHVRCRCVAPACRRALTVVRSAVCCGCRYCCRCYTTSVLPLNTVLHKGALPRVAVLTRSLRRRVNCASPRRFQLVAGSLRLCAAPWSLMSLQTAVERASPSPCCSSRALVVSRLVAAAASASLLGVPLPPPPSAPPAPLHSTRYVLLGCVGACTSALSDARTSAAR